MRRGRVHFRQRARIVGTFVTLPDALPHSAGLSRRSRKCTCTCDRRNARDDRVPPFAFSEIKANRCSTGWNIGIPVVHRDCQSLITKNKKEEKHERKMNIKMNLANQLTLYQYYNFPLNITGGNITHVLHLHYR